MPEHKVMYAMPTLITDVPTPQFARLLFCWIRNSLALLGFLLIAGGLFLYFKGYYASTQLDDDFLPTFNQFIQHALREDVPSALLKRFSIGDSLSLAELTEKLVTEAEALALTVTQQQPLSESLILFEFCDPATLQRWIEAQVALALLNPCQIALYQHDNGQIEWLMLNHALLTQGSRQLDKPLQARILTLQDSLLALMVRL